MPRPLDDMFAHGESKPSIRDETPEERDAPAAEPVADKKDAKPEASETPAEAKPKAETKPKVTESQDDGDDADRADPADLEGYKKALGAARGDKRKMRKQWQEAERKLAELEGRMAVLAQQSQRSVEQPAQAKQPTQEEIEAQYWENPAKFTLQRLQEGQQTVTQAVQSELRRQHHEAYVARLYNDLPAAKAQYQDYDEQAAGFLEAVKADPRLEAQIKNHPQPAVFAYKVGREWLLRKETGGDFDALEKRIEERVRAKIAAESGEQTEQVEDETPARAQIQQIPKSTAGARGSGPGATGAGFKPSSLDRMFR